jgi:hypothetical protein
MFNIPEVLPFGLYVDLPDQYYGNNYDMIIIDPNQFKNILLKNGFHAYFSFLEETICSYGSYLSNFNTNESESYKEEVYTIL